MGQMPRFISALQWSNSTSAMLTDRGRILALSWVVTRESLAGANLVEMTEPQAHFFRSRRMVSTCCMKSRTSWNSR